MGLFPNFLLFRPCAASPGPTPHPRGKRRSVCWHLCPAAPPTAAVPSLSDLLRVHLQELYEHTNVKSLTSSGLGGEKLCWSFCRDSTDFINQLSGNCRGPWAVGSPCPGGPSLRVSDPTLRPPGGRQSPSTGFARSLSFSRIILSFRAPLWMTRSLLPFIFQH